MLHTPKTSTPEASLFMNGDGFYYMEGFGNLCVQLIVDVSSLPKKDVQLTHLLAGGKYQKTGATLDTYVQLQNVGQEDISSMRLGYRFDDGEATYKDYNEEVKADGVDGVNLQLPLPKDITPGAHKLTVFVDNIGAAHLPIPMATRLPTRSWSTPRALNASKPTWSSIAARTRVWPTT